MGGVLVRLATSVLTTCLGWVAAASLAAWVLGVSWPNVQALGNVFSVYGLETGVRVALMDLRVVGALLIGAAVVLGFQLLLLNFSVALLIKTDGDLQRLEAGPRL